MHVVTWNIHCLRGAGRRLARLVDALCSTQPDIVLLQEVAARWKIPERLRDDLARGGLPHFVFSGSALDHRRRYGNVIASRWPLEASPRDWAPGAPFPQLLAKAVVDAPAGPVELVSVHIPNGAGNGWKKIETFEALASYLQHAPRAPRVVAGDFNEPHWFEPDGTPSANTWATTPPAPT